MPRKNRQKLHQELRLRAEAHQALQRAQRLARKAESTRIAAVAEAVLRGQAPPPRPIQPKRPGRLFRSLAYLMRMAGITAAEQRQLRRLTLALEAEAPGLAKVDAFPWLILLARQRWVRAPETFRLADGAADPRQALAKHLLVRWPVPGFLLRAVDVTSVDVARIPVEDEWAVGLLAHIGAGRSLRDAVGTAILPAPLTRAMQHLLLQQPADVSPVAALRAAQVRGAGGSRALVDVLLTTRLGVVRGPDLEVGEPFWHTIIGWLAARPDLAFEAMDSALADATLGWIEAERRKGLVHGSAFSLKGRTAASIRRSVAEWSEAERARGLAVFPADGLLPLELPGEDGGAWAFIGLGSPTALLEEAKAMSHCAVAYAWLSKAKKVSLWSLRRRDVTGEERRVATIEVALGAGAVVQAKGFGNAACPEPVKDVVARWAEVNRLTVELRG